jgi:acetyl esterase
MPYAIDPELAAMIPMLPIIDISDLSQVRADLIELAAALGQPDATGVQFFDKRVPGASGDPEVPIRIYRPDRAATSAAVYTVHGGGFVLGDIETSHARSIELCRELGVVVVSVDYRLAPEAPFPGPLEDVYAGLVWLADNAADLGVDPRRIAIHGVSAGGGLCAGLALAARDRGGPHIAFQYLAIPEVDDRLRTQSMTDFADTPIWNRPNAVISWDAYLGVGVRGTTDVSPYAAPARASDLSGLPPAYISVMHFDPLRDEGIAYGLALLAAGVTVELHLFPGTFHGSVLLSEAGISQRDRAEEVLVLSRGLQL